MRSWIVATMLAMTGPAHSQTLPYSFQKSSDPSKPDTLDATAVQEDMEFLANQAKQNKAAITAVTVSAGVLNVTASPPLSSSGGTNPNISLSGTLAQSQVTNLVSDLAGKAPFFTGISSTCATGFHVSQTVTVNGVTVGGICASDGAGNTITSSVTVVNSSFTFSGPNGYVTTASSVTASSFFGDGSHLTGIQTGSAGTLGYLLDNLLVTQPPNGTTRAFTLSQTPSPNSEQVDLDGTLLSPASDYVLVGNTLTLSSAPAAPPVTTRFFVRYSTGASGIPQVGLVGYVVDNLLVTGALNGVNTNFTLSQTPSPNSEQVNLDGTLLSPASDYVLTGTSLVLSSAPAPAPQTTRFFVRYSTGASGVNAMILTATQAPSGVNTWLSTGVFRAPVVFSTGTGTQGQYGIIIGTQAVFQPITAPSGIANVGLLYYDNATQNFMVNQNNGGARPLVDPPGTWGCTIRSGTAINSSNCNSSPTFSTVSCSGTEKAISGGCHITGVQSSGGSIQTIGYPSTASQGWSCDNICSTNPITVTAVANCCL